MPLPLELIQYAENLYRRFPEEFIALGAPGLEEVFDLRANGTWSRRIHETPTEKTVEITLRRLQLPLAVTAPGYPPQFAAQHPMCAQPTMWPGVAGVPWGVLPQYLPPPPGPAAPPAATTGSAPAAAPEPGDDAATARLVRLESALAALKPQIEAVLKAQARANSQLQAQRQPSPQRASQADAAGSDAADLGAGEGQQPQEAPEDPAERRKRPVSIQIPRKQSQDGRAPAVVKLEGAGGEGEPADTAKLADGTAKAGESRRPGRIDPVRMGPSSTDPASPRSPGRYSAWS